MTKREEQAYSQGSRAAWHNILLHAVRALGYESTEAKHAAWITEREEAIATLRELCGEHGDNDWPNELHLSDIIDKHLGRHLQ